MRPAELEELLQKPESHRRELVRQVQEMSEEETSRRPVSLASQKEVRAHEL